MLTLFWQSVPEDLQDTGRELVDKGEQLIESAKADPVLAGVLIAIGVITAIIFVWGLFKQVFKAAFVAAALSAGAWYWYFQIREG